MNNWNEDRQDSVQTYAPRVEVKTDALVDGFVLPSLQMLLTGVLAGVAVAVVLAIFRVEWWWKAAAVVMVLTWLVTWLLFRGEWRYRLERMLGVDITGDGYIGAPVADVQPAPPPIRVELVEDNGRSMRFIDLPASQKLPLLAREALAGRQFSQTAMVNSGYFTRSEYDSLITALVQAGLLTWKNPEHHNAGCVVTRAGRHVLKRLADMPPTIPRGE